MLGVAQGHLLPREVPLLQHLQSRQIDPLLFVAELLLFKAELLLVATELLTTTRGGSLGDHAGAGCVGYTDGHGLSPHA